MAGRLAALAPAPARIREPEKGFLIFERFNISDSKMAASEPLTSRAIESHCNGGRSKMDPEADRIPGRAQ